MIDIYGYGPDCCGPDDTAYVNRKNREGGEVIAATYSPDPEDVLPLADAATGLTGPAANAPYLTAGGPQEPRSAPAPAIPTPLKGPALRIDLRAGIVDLLAVPLDLLYGARQWRGQIAGEEVIWRDAGEYRRVLDLANEGGWSWSATGSPPGVAIITRLQMSGGAA